MENGLSPLRLYELKIAKEHSSEEIKAAFESSFSVCFNYDRGHKRALHELFAAIWQENPLAILTKVDLCITNATASALWEDQLLLIDLSGTDDTKKKISSFMDESGIISYQCRFDNRIRQEKWHGWEAPLTVVRTDVIYKGELDK